MTTPTATVSPEHDTDVCEEEGCGNDELLALVSPDAGGDGRVLCPTHRVEYLREVYDT